MESHHDDYRKAASCQQENPKSAITGHILDKENAQLKCFSNEPDVIIRQPAFFIPCAPLFSLTFTRRSILPFYSSLLFFSQVISYSINCWKSINVFPYQWRIDNFQSCATSVLLCHARLHGRSCTESYYLHSDLFCCGCDPYNHRHVFDIFCSRGNGPRACGMA